MPTTIFDSVRSNIRSLNEMSEAGLKIGFDYDTGGWWFQWSGQPCHHGYWGLGEAVRAAVAAYFADSSIIWIED